jgi:hypothetical protein
MKLTKRLKNLWLLSGIEVGEIGPKAEVVDKITEIFKTPSIKQEKKMAVIIKRNQQEDDHLPE